MNFDDLSPSEMLSTGSQEDNNGKGRLGNFQICGKDVPRGYWVDIERLYFTLLTLLPCYSLLIHSASTVSVRQTR